MSNKGILYGIATYMMWGFFPLYFKALHVVPALQIMFHRVVWCFLFLAVVILVKKEWPNFKAEVQSKRVLAIYALAAILLATNWLVYIFGINSGQVLETSLGYFINPLFSVALGVIFLKEKLRPMQWLPIGLAAAGVIYLTIQHGTLPWIALALAFTFGLYGLVKKVSPLGSLHGLTLETTILFLPALGYLLYAESQGSGAFGHTSWQVTLLLALSGVVTAIPLLLFAAAARSIPLYMIGILQYIAPTLQFLLGVLVFKEPFTPARVIGFSVIWLALLLYSVENYVVRRRVTLPAAAS
jgi:chloramphenicol-sensitive protein RarD